MRRACLINPPTSVFERSFYFPLALLAVAAPVQKRGVAISILDLDFEARRQQALQEHTALIQYTLTQLAAFNPDVIGITSICSNFPIAILIARSIRKAMPRVKIIMGGAQPSSLPDETLKIFPEIDAIVVGEGETTFCQIMESDLTPEALTQIPGVAVRSGHQVIRSAARPLRPNLDDYPPPDYSLLPIQEYLAYAKQYNINFNGHVEVGRGCPFHCTFCSTSIMWERTFRVKSPQRVLDEMTQLHLQYGFNNFVLTHDNFTTSRKFVLEFCDYMVRHNRMGLLWGVSSRIDCIDPERVARMKAAGCNGLFFGIESGSQRMQPVIGKRLQLNKFDDLLTHAVRQGIYSTTAFIVGFPEETEEDLNQTILAAFRYKSLGANNVFFSKLTALAGTGVYKSHLDALTLETYTSTASPLPYFSPEVVDMIRQWPQLFSSYYSVPAPHLTHIHLPALIVFYHALIESLREATVMMFELMGWQPTKLFQKWLVWYLKTHADETINGTLVVQTFSEFLRELTEDPVSLGQADIQGLGHINGGVG